MLTYTSGEFRNYCMGQLDSIKLAIKRKSNGSPSEDAYFLEHLDKLKDFFLDKEITIKGESE